MKKLSKRAETLSLGVVPTAVITLVVLAILVGIGASILYTTGQNACTGTGFVWNTTPAIPTCYATTGGASGPIAFNATANGQTSMNTFGSWLPTIAIVLAASVVIGLVTAYLMGRRNE